VLSAPSEPAHGSERDLHHRCAVGEDAVVEGAQLRDHAIGERLELRAQHLVIVAPERVAGYEGARGIFERFPCVARSARRVVQSRGDDGNRAWHQFRGTRTARAVARHIIHLAVPSAAEPLDDGGFVAREVRARDRHRIEPELASPGFARFDARFRMFPFCGSPKVELPASATRLSAVLAPRGAGDSSLPAWRAGRRQTTVSGGCFAR
jgi:hypothetical protein